MRPPCPRFCGPAKKGIIFFKVPAQEHYTVRAIVRCRDEFDRRERVGPTGGIHRREAAPDAWLARELTTAGGSRGRREIVPALVAGWADGRLRMVGCALDAE